MNNVMSLEFKNGTSTAIFTVGRPPVQNMWAIKWEMVILDVRLTEIDNEYDVEVIFTDGTIMNFSADKKQIVYYSNENQLTQAKFIDGQLEDYYSSLGFGKEEKQYDEEYAGEKKKKSVKNIRPITL